MTQTPLTVDLADRHFNKISTLVKDLCGINLHDGKKELIKARLTKRLRRLQLRSFEEYIQHLKNDTTGTELTAMLDALSTNLTSFFREPDHFEHLANHAIPPIVHKAGKGGGRLRIWSAGCSSGEEPYSIAITVSESIPNLKLWDVGILGTDLSTRVLSAATEGIYKLERIKPIPSQQRYKYLTCIQARPERIYQVNDDIKRMVCFSRLNLMTSWPMRGPFDMIFCRNVMIYFDKPTQQNLIDRFCDILTPGGTLFIGHSESLTGVRHRFKYIQPTVYQKT